MKDTEFYKVEEFAEIMLRHPRTIRRWIAENYIHGAIKIRTVWIIPKSEVDRIFGEANLKKLTDIV